MEAIHASLDGETKNMIEASLNRFVDTAYEPTARLKRLHGAEVNYRAYWPSLVELGVLGLPVDEAQGGIGGSTQDMGDALRVLARGLVLEPLIECAVLASTVLRRGGDAVAAQAAIDCMISGEALTILIGGRNGDALHCTQNDTGYLLAGKTRMVPGAAQADIWLIACVDEAGTCRILRVPRQDMDAQVESYRMMDGRSASDVTLNNTQVLSACLWLQGQAAQDALNEAAAQAVSAYCADAVGVMQALVKTTGEYLRTREQFGVLLSSFQALQHRYADMHMATLESRAISRLLAKSLDGAQTAQIEWLRFAAPAVVARCSSLVGHEAIQMHGGMGVTDELIVSHYNSRLVVLNKLLERWASEPAPATQTAGDSGDRHAG